MGAASLLPSFEMVILVLPLISLHWLIWYRILLGIYLYYFDKKWSTGYFNKFERQMFLFTKLFIFQAKTNLIHFILHNRYAFRNDMHCGVFLKSAFYGLMRHFCYAFSSFYFCRYLICVYNSARILQKLSHEPDTILFFVIKRNQN